MTHILTLSAHSISLDRRVISQVNALTKIGYDITLASVPIPDDCSHLIDPAIQQAIPFISDRHNENRYSILKNMLKKFIPNQILEKLQFQKRRRFYRSLEAYFISVIPKKAFQVIHAHDLITLSAAIKIRDSYCPEAKIIYDAHELYPQQFNNKNEQQYWKTIETSLLKDVAHVIVINPSFKKQFEKSYKNCPPIDIIYNSYGLNLPKTLLYNRITLKKYIGCSNDLPICVFYGGLSNHRNLENLVKAFTELKKKCNLLIIGKGPATSSLQKIKKSYGLDNVYFLSWVKQDMLSSIIKNVDFGIIPYQFDGKLNHLYCTPNKLFELIHFKIPVLASNLPEIANIINKYQVGKVYELSSVEYIKNAIIDFLCYKNSISSNDFDQAIDKYNWEKQEETLLSIYKKII